MVHGALCLARLDDGTSLLRRRRAPRRAASRWSCSTARAGCGSRTPSRSTAPSAHRVDAPCPYYGECGGCQLQHVDYAHQLELKAEIVRDAMRRQDGARSPDAWSRARRRRALALPLARRVPRHPRCRGDGRRAARVQPRAQLDARRGRRLPHPPPPHHHVAAGADEPGARRRAPRLTALHLTAGEGGDELLLRPRPPRAVPAAAVDEHARAAGQRWSTTSTTLSWRGHDYRVSPDTFIQVNWGSLELLYGAALRGLGDVAGPDVVDAYAGVGVLACELAAQGASVVCIESNRDSARLGVLNAELNGCAGARALRRRARRGRARRRAARAPTRCCSTRRAPAATRASPRGWRWPARRRSCTSRATRPRWRATCACSACRGRTAIERRSSWWTCSRRRTTSRAW